MAYTPINTALIEVGKPVKKEIFDTIRANQEDFNASIQGLQQASTVDVFNLKFGGNLNQYSQTEIDARLPVYKAPASITLTAFSMTLLTASTSGTLEVDIEKSTDNGATFSTLLSSPVQLTGLTVGSISGSVLWISAAAQDIAQGDLLRVRVLGAQVDQGEFQLSIYGELL